MSGVLDGIFGGTPKVQADNSAKKESRKARKVRSALYETEGGASGEELGDGQIVKRDTLLGN